MCLLQKLISTKKPKQENSNVAKDTLCDAWDSSEALLPRRLFF